MSSIQHTAARRATHVAGAFTLVRRGAELCLATHAVTKKGGEVRARTYDHRLSSAGLARRLEGAFWEWLERVPALRSEPAAALGMVVRYAAHLDGLVRTFEFHRALHPDQHTHEVLRLALERFDAALWVAYRRMGRRWA